MTKQWILIALVMALALGACLSMPVMAERMIEGSANLVETEDTAQPEAQQNREAAAAAGGPVLVEDREMADEQIAEWRKKMAKDATNVPLAEVPLSDDAKAALGKAARQAVFEKLGMTVLPDYQSLDIAAYEEDGDARCVVSLMPPNWELVTDALVLPGETVSFIEIVGADKPLDEGSQRGTDKNICEAAGGEDGTEVEMRMISAAAPYYTVTFGGIDPETGDASVLGVQMFRLSGNPAVEVDYSDGQRAAMVEAAMKYARDKLGVEPGDEIGSDKLSGSFETGMGFTFALEGGDSLTVNVSEEGHVNGYSFIPPKG